MKRKIKTTISSDAGSADNLKEWPYEVLKRFRLIFKAVQQHSQWVETRYGVTSAQLWAMWELSRNPELKVTELAKAMSIHHSTVSNLLDKLAKKGLVKRERVSLDQRVVTVSLTQDGIDLIAQAPAAPQGILQHALFNLPENVLESLAKDLDSLIEGMAIMDEEAAMQPLNPLPKGIRTAKKKE